MPVPPPNVSDRMVGGENIDPAIGVSTKRGRGKPTLYTAELSQTILRDIEQGVPKTKAYVGNGISLQTGYDWEKAHPEFAEAVKCAREQFRASWRPARPRSTGGQLPSLTLPSKLADGIPIEGRQGQCHVSSGPAKATLTIVLPSKQLPAVAR